MTSDKIRMILHRHHILPLNAEDRPAAEALRMLERAASEVDKRIRRANEMKKETRSELNEAEAYAYQCIGLLILMGVPNDEAVTEVRRWRE